MKRAHLSRRGAASVETALLMIVLIPTILYTMYLEDLLIYKFDLEETVVSSPWDFNTHDYRKNDTDTITGTMRQSAMQTFWDHTSAWNSYENANYDAKDQGGNNSHHQAMAAHQCWLAEGGKEIECSVDTMTGMLIEPTFNFKNKGGLASCTAVLGVQNYFLPEQFFHWWGKVSIKGDGNREMKRHTSTDIHGNAKSDPYLYPAMHFGVMADTWALYKTENIDPLMHPAEQMTEFVSWVRIPYGLRAGKLSDANKFASDAIQKKILNNLAQVDGTGDTLLTPPVAYDKQPRREVGGHYTSGWSDPAHSGTQQGMTNAYMGMPTNTW